MKEKRETEKFMNTQSADKGYTVSRSYLAEVFLDKLWEQNFTSGNLPKADRDSQGDTCIPGKNSRVSSEKDAQTFM
ncbi:hypothetical protein ACTRXD_10720 [Nitrospira sp. T9]|uniref:hypothetical protein n=1 Tax=unclassified Nitrospira TaxID=2652172 RepID=UPI003F989E47